MIINGQRRPRRTSAKSLQGQNVNHFSRIGLVAALLITVAFCATGCQNATSYTSKSLQEDTSGDKFSRLDRYIRDAMKRWDVPGLAIAVVQDDSTLFAKGYGVRQVGSSDSVNTSTIFSLLSPTKTFTTTALAMLVEKGKIAWDDRVVRHLPDFRVGDSLLTQKLTIRDLVSHRSGYADPYHLWFGTDLSREEIINKLATIEPDAPLRSKFQYNNVMYLVAAEVIEATSGMSWDDFIRERIFAPLNMDRSLTTTAALGERSNVVSPHSRRFFGVFGDIQPDEMFPLDNIAPAGGIQTTVEDMSAWLKLHINGGEYKGKRLLKETSIKALRGPNIMFPSDQLGPLRRVTDQMAYGMGWFVLDYRGRKAIMHGGGAPGQRSYVGILPSEELGVVILTNMHGTEIAQALTYYVFDLFLKENPLDWSRIFYDALRPWWQFW